jgi:RNA polymerase sigma factor (sigma-70 family)
MQPTDDGTLLRQYSEDHSDDAFAALVTRHINLVYSVALRQVGDPHQAEEITQAVFILLAKKAAQLRHDKALSSWLFQATRLTARNFVRGETRRHHREQEAHMQSVLNESGGDIWPGIAPLLDDAVAGLSEEDRHAIVLRFYEGRNLRDVGAALGASEDAAEKRVNRAVEKLRTFFAKRGVTVGTSGLVVVISANAVQAAPVGLAVTISSTVALTGTTLTATATAVATKAIAMTALQKTLIAATVAVLAGAGIYETRQASTLRAEVRTLRQQQTPPAESIQTMQRERDEAANQLAAALAENDRLRRDSAELPKLRGDLMRASRELAQLRAEGNTVTNDPLVEMSNAWTKRALSFKLWFQQNPDKSIPELQLLDSRAWLGVAINNLVVATNDQQKADHNTIEMIASGLRQNAKGRFARILGHALTTYAAAHAGALPDDLTQLVPYLSPQQVDAYSSIVTADPSFLQRYQLLRTGPIGSVPQGEPIVVEKAPVDARVDTLLKIQAGSYSFESVGIKDMMAQTLISWDQKDVEALRPFLK